MQDDNEVLFNSVDPAKLVWVHSRQEMETPPQGVTFTNWPLFNELTGGLRPKEFSILCGPTGKGKTSLLANFSANLLTQRIPHFVASVETGQVDFVSRVVSVLIDEDLNTGNAIPKSKLDTVSEQLDIFLGPEAKNFLWLSNIENRMSVDFLCRKLEYVHEKLGCKVAMLDNLNFFLEVKSAKDSLMEMDRVIHELIMLSKRIDMHTIMVMHPKKTDGGRVESEFDIKGSSTAVQEAHNVFLFNAPKADSKHDKHFRELKAAKLRRRGRYSGKTVVYDGTRPSYREVEIL